MPPHADALRVAIAGCHRHGVGRARKSQLGLGIRRDAGDAGRGGIRQGAGTREEFRACWRDSWGDVADYDDYDAMLEKVRPDIVCVATRQTYHAEHIEAAVKAGVKGIVCDKPLCTTLDEADRILAALRQADVPLAFGLELRWSKQYQTLIQMLKNGAIGDVAPY